MSSVTDHYAYLLAPVYTWMAGGAEAALALGAADLADLPGPGRLAVDLGAGFGMHAIALARAGWPVLAIDSSAELLRELATLAQGLPVRAHCDDLLRFGEHLAPGEQADLILCMGDTLTHLDSEAVVGALVQHVARHLAPGGRFVATFRDYTRLPAGESRFIPVRADSQRILTCFLEEFPDHVQVHDLLHQLVDGRWQLQVGSYRKLRLAPQAVCQRLQAAGLQATLGTGPRGMIRLDARA